VPGRNAGPGGVLQAACQGQLEIVALSLDEDGDIAKVRRFAQPFTFPVGMKTAAQVDGFDRIVLPLLSGHY
jgi:glucose/arabinose dehydrogenase